MKRRVAILVALAGVGCRAVIGIDPLELADAGADASIDASDGAAGDAGSAGDAAVADANVEAEAAAVFPDASASIADCVDAGAAECRKCCRDTFKLQVTQLETDAINAGCICGAGQCTDTANGCAEQACASPRKEPTQPCGPCEDIAFLSATAPCASARTACDHDPACAAALDCMTACPK